MAAKVVRVSDSTERQIGIQGSGEGDEMVGLAEDFAQAAAHWRNVAEIEQVSICRTPGATSGRADSVQPRLTTTDGAREADTSPVTRHSRVISPF